MRTFPASIWPFAVDASVGTTGTWSDNSALNEGPPP
jgi:hypothetical protein